MVSDAIFLTLTLEIKKLQNKIVWFCQITIKSFLLAKQKKANCYLLENEITYIWYFCAYYFYICSS